MNWTELGLRRAGAPAGPCLASAVLAAHRRQDQEARAERDRRAVDAIRVQARSHAETQSIGALVRAMRRRPLSPEIAAWADWALEVASSLDPVT